MRVLARCIVLIWALACWSGPSHSFPFGFVILEDCDGYAQGAENAARLNVENNCGFTGARWGANREAHANYCRNTPASDVKEESGKRTRQLTSCMTCRAHAKKAMNQLKAAHTLHCFSDNKSNKALNADNFDPNEDGHFKRCYAVVSTAYGDNHPKALATIKRAENNRHEALKTCVRQVRHRDNPAEVIWRPGPAEFCHDYAFPRKNSPVKSVDEQLNNSCAPPDDGARWSRDRYQHYTTCLLAWKGDIKFDNIGQFFEGERQAREDEIRHRADTTDCDGPGQTKQPLTVEEPKITDPEGPKLDTRRVPPKITDPEGPSLKTPRGGQVTGGRDGSGDPGKPIPPQRGGPTLATPSPKNTPKPNGGSNGSGCGSAMDRLSGCIPAGAGGGSTFTPRDPYRPAAGAGGGGAGGGAPAAKPPSSYQPNPNIDYGIYVPPPSKDKFVPPK